MEKCCHLVGEINDWHAVASWSSFPTPSTAVLSLCAVLGSQATTIPTLTRSTRWLKISLGWRLTRQRSCRWAAGLAQGCLLHKLWYNSAIKLSVCFKRINKKQTLYTCLSVGCKLWCWRSVRAPLWLWKSENLSVNYYICTLVIFGRRNWCWVFFWNRKTSLTPLKSWARGTV